MKMTDMGPARGDNATQQQRNPLRRQLSPPVTPHVQGNFFTSDFFSLPVSFFRQLPCRSNNQKRNIKSE